jgi:hypothetical protein
MTSHGYKQNKISQELSMGTKIFKISHYTALGAFSFKKIKILIGSATLKFSFIGCFINFQKLKIASRCRIASGPLQSKYKCPNSASVVCSYFAVICSGFL